ncbi:MAG: acyl-ACP--UDP-N-acetylglucosamine O-acyltransferase [Bacteroidia bacterium]
MISPLASIDPKAQLGTNVTVSPFATIFGDVQIGDGTWIGPNSVIMDGARIGKNCKIFPGAVISAIPQDLKYKGEYTTAEIGDNTTIRECVTFNKGTADRNTTKVGSNCLLMAYVHVGHDTIIGNNVILANSVAVAGHINIEDWVICEGNVAIQQFVTIGAHAFIAGASLVRKNVPPYIRVAREPLQYIGVNTVGLTRRGFSKEAITLIEDIYRLIFIRGHNVSKALELVEAEITETPERLQIVDFIRNSKDGIVKGI